MAEYFILQPGALTLQSIKHVLNQQLKCSLAEDALTQINASHQTVKKVILDKKTVYGINTGFGSLANQTISSDNLKQLQKNIVLSHACGTGELLSDEIVALILLLKINNLAQGYSGVRLELIETLISLYNHRIYPCIPSKGSVGASGDLAPLAHMSLPLLGVGDVHYQGKKISALEGLKVAGLKPIELEAKEGLALLNGLQVSTAIALTALFATENLFETALITGALSVDAANGSDVPFDDRIQKVRGHEAQRSVAACYRELLAGSQIRESHLDCARVQDPYSLRCQPQIMGAVLHQIQFVKETLQVEVNAISDNPLVFSEQEQIISGGNFHGEIVAMAADNLALAIAEIGSNAERRIALLIDKNFSNLPAFLIKESGLNSGFMIAHVTAAACASENKALAHPHSVDSLPTSANQEDHVSMATSAARRLHAMNDNTATILAIELLAASQGVEFHKPLKSSQLLEEVHQRLRSYVQPYDSDRFFAPDIDLVKEKILAGEFTTPYFHLWDIK
ncbi:histidine ammonia-lyase [Legionella longbeachae]|uniref:Histidine ammonia-lyase n=1 Tax=Legionella longbeachae serogroup 1 (strain NSW150) TaxID=661367 RepID=D3HSE9_LEGLN|nr:histidine ammonia-lyase [Legionella longbeachae]VEE02331.1 histidine ammonia-lyase (Histidase) [Legionella oakridgensis]HBD7398177.1 histidine ammonia-lyase [Legionella pneumophila]ARB91383.1 histidine ammonia-lyase [Legionella longbeachae]ARM32191.1 histidine ammonia-lyase [Legionella longbeachae]QIN35544.1 histidine ammonia-lyase [Legionella longbeachae]